MTLDGKNGLLIIGGWSQPFSSAQSSTSSIARFDLDTGAYAEVGRLPYGACWNLRCVHLPGEKDVLVCGGWDAGNTENYIQVLNVTTASVVHSIKLPFVGMSHVYGCVVVEGVEDGCGEGGVGEGDVLITEIADAV